MQCEVQGKTFLKGREQRQVFSSSGRNNGLAGGSDEGGGGCSGVGVVVAFGVMLVASGGITMDMAMIMVVREGDCGGGSSVFHDRKLF